MKFFGTTLIFLLAFAAARAQGMTTPDTVIVPGGNTIRQDYLKKRNVFEKLSWLDSAGNLRDMRTLNLVTRIDTLHSKLIFLQLRNDGKIDSTIAEWPSLKPVYSSERSPNGHESIFDYTAGNKVRLIEMNNGKKISDTSYPVNTPFFDGFLTDYIIGGLPLKPGYHARLTLASSKPFNATVKEVHTDILTGGDGRPVAVYLATIDFNGTTVLYWIDRTSGEIIKYLTDNPGIVFTKTRI